MSESLALIISGISIAGSIAGVFFFKGQFKKELYYKESKIKELESAISNLKANSKQDEALKSNSILQAEKEQLSLELQNITSQLSSSNSEIFSLKEENSIILAQSEQTIYKLQEQISELEEKIKSVEDLTQNTVKQSVETQSDNPVSILFVDDSSVIRLTMKKFLVGSGYNLTMANDGVEALAILEKQKFDLIITDLEMPNLDGFGLLEKVWQNPETKHIPMIVVTGHEEVEVKLSKTGALFGLFKKPWNEEELLNRIKALSSIKVQGQ